MKKNSKDSCPICTNKMLIMTVCAMALVLFGVIIGHYF